MNNLDANLAKWRAKGAELQTMRLAGATELQSRAPCSRLPDRRSVRGGFEANHPEQ
jgi:hypothetical protein